MSEDNSRKRLGRGLAALMGELDKPTVTARNKSAREEGSLITGERDVPIERIRANPRNPRRTFLDAELDELAGSIREHGIVQPILVRPISDEDPGGAMYEIIAGERRWRAAQKAQLHEVPIVVREVGDRQALELAIIENVQRSDLDSVEEAMGYQQLIDEYEYSQNDLAQVIGKSRSHVANTLRRLKLPKSVQTMIGEGALSAGHARTLVTAQDPEGLAKRIIKEGLSVRQAELLAQNAFDGDPKKSSTSGKAKSSDIRALEQKLEDKLGLKVDLRHNEKGKGELRIKYRSLDQLDNVCRKLESDI